MAKPRPTPKQPPSRELLLDKPRLQLPRSGVPFEVFFYTVLTLLGGFGALCCLSTAFGLPLDTAPLILLGILCGVWGVLQSVLSRSRVVLLAAGALAWGVALLYFSDVAAEGAGRVLNIVLGMYSEKLRIPLAQFAVPEATPRQELYTSTVFVAILLPPFFWVLSWLLARRRSSAAAFSFTGATLSLSLALSIIPEFWALCMLLLFWCMLLLSAPVLGRRHRVLDERRRFIVCGAAVRPVLLALLPAAALCMLLLYLLFPQETYTRPHFVNDLRSGFVNGFGLEALLQGGQGSNNTRVSLNDLRERAYSGKTAMRVHYQWEESPSGETQLPQKDYLKSFAGSVYTGRSWERLPREQADELEAFMPPGRVQNMAASFTGLFPLPGFESDLRYNLAVESITTNPRCLFTPYGLSSGEDITGLQAEYVDDAFLRSSNMFSGTHAYQCNAVARPETGRSYGIRAYEHWQENLLITPQQPYLEAFLSDGLRQSLYFDAPNPAGVLMNQLTSGKGAAALLQDSLSLKLPAWAKEPLSPERRALIDLTEQYNDFVLKTYLQLPQELKTYLDAFRAGHGLTLGQSPDGAPQEVQGEAAYESFLAQLKEVFSAGYSYTLTPTPVPDGRDFTEFFLSESKAGYCVHFATAAAALCRSAGIPARYAEGYAVPCGNSGVWVDVPDRNAHAWLEVYYSGSGWIPVEVTPESPDAPATYYNAQSPGDSSLEGEGQGEIPQAGISPSPSPSATPTARPSVHPGPSAQPSEGSTPQGGTRKEEEKPLWPLFLMGIGALLLCLFGLMLNRAVHKSLRKKAFSQPDRNQAALALYKHLLKLHKLEATLYYGDRRPPPYWEETALKARFGRGMLPEDEWLRLAADAAKLENSLKEGLPKDRKLYWAYVKALF